MTLTAFNYLLVWIWYVKLDAPISTIIGILFMLFSILIVLGELTIFSNFGINIFGSIAKEDYSYWKSQVTTLFCGSSCNKIPVVLHCSSRLHIDLLLYWTVQSQNRESLWIVSTSYRLSQSHLCSSVNNLAFTVNFTTFS